MRHARSLRERALSPELHSAPALPTHRIQPIRFTVTIMLAGVFQGPNSVVVRQVPDPVPGPGEVLIRVAACGICGTDLRIEEGQYHARYPLIPGHEFCGEVLALGPGAGDFSLGQRVAVNPNNPCRRCVYCLRGKFHLCENSTACGVTYDGGFAQLCKVPGQLVLKLPESDLPIEHWALMEPTSCCLHGIDVAGIRPGDSVVILGAGSIGLILLQLARFSGAAQLLISEPSAPKRALALQLGADKVLDPLALGDDLPRAVRDFTGGGADVVIEAAGLPATASVAPGLACRGGTVLFFGVCPPDLHIPLNPHDVFHNELTLRGSYTNPSTDSRALRLIASGRVQVGPLVSHRFPLTQLPAALTAVRQGETVKALVIP